MKQPKTLLLIHAKSFLYKEKTGVERYVFELVSQLIDIFENREKSKFAALVDVVVYIDGEFTSRQGLIFKNIRCQRFWTIFGLSFEIVKTLLLNYFKRKYSRIILFCPAHNFPLILPKERVVTIHGLEYEKAPFCYSFFHRWYLRLVTKFSVKKATKIIAVSETTKSDLINLYKVESDKIKVIYHGIEKTKHSFKEWQKKDKKYITFIGRIEYKKNLTNLIKSFNLIIKEKPVLAKYKIFIGGTNGYGYNKIKDFIVKNSKQIRFIDRYINDKEKNKILSQTGVFYFVSCYEGFGMPVLEMQSLRIPILVSKNGASSEIAGKGVLTADPYNCEDIKTKLKIILENKTVRRKLIKSGVYNLKRFNDWRSVAFDTLNYILN